MSEEKLLPAVPLTARRDGGRTALGRWKKHQLFITLFASDRSIPPPNEARINHSKEPKHHNSRNTAPSCTWLSRLGRQLLVTDSSQNRLKQKCLNFTQAVIYLQQVSGSNGIYEKKML